MSENITQRQRLFIAEYAKDFNGTQAAIRAGYSARTAGEQASRLLANVRVKEALERAKENRLKKAGVHAERVLTEIARLSFSDNRKLYSEDGTLKSPKDWDDDTAAAIAGVEVFEEFSGKGEERQLTGFTKKIRMWDKSKNLEILAKHLGLIKEKLEVGGDDGKPIEFKWLSEPNDNNNPV